MCDLVQLTLTDYLLPLFEITHISSAWCAAVRNVQGFTLLADPKRLLQLHRRPTSIRSCNACSTLNLHHERMILTGPLFSGGRFDCETMVAVTTMAVPVLLIEP